MSILTMVSVWKLILLREPEGLEKFASMALRRDGLAVGDVIIIISYAFMAFEEAKTFKPVVVFPGYSQQ